MFVGRLHSLFDLRCKTPCRGAARPSTLTRRRVHSNFSSLLQLACTHACMCNESVLHDVTSTYHHTRYNTRLLLLRTLRCHSKPHRAWVVQSSSDFAPSEIRLRRGAKVTPVRCSHESCQFAGAVKTPRIVDEQVACMRWPGGTAEAISDLERVNGGRCALKFLPIAPVGVLPVVVSCGN